MRGRASSLLSALRLFEEVTVTTPFRMLVTPSSWRRCSVPHTWTVFRDFQAATCREACSKGNISFTLQNNGLASEGTATLVWEALEQLTNSGVKELGSVVVQVGGGALASGILTGLRYSKNSGEMPCIPTLHTVQPMGCAPLARCYKRLIQDVECRHGLGGN